MKQTTAVWMAALTVLGTYPSLGDLTDLEKANKLLQKDEDDRDHGALQKIAEAWDKDDAKGLFNWVIKETPGHLDVEDEEEFFAIAGSRLAQRHPEDALAYIDRTFRLMRNGDEESAEAFLIKSMVKQLLFSDAAKMVQWTKAKPDRDALIYKVEGDLIDLYARYAPEYVLERAKTEDSLSMMKGRSGAFNSLAKKDWKAAASYLADLKQEDHQRRWGVGSLAIHLSSSDAEAALAWLQDLDAELAEAVRLAWMKDRDPAEARKFLEAKLKEAGSLDDKFYEVVSGWASKDPDGARQWSEALPEGSGRMVAVGAVVDAWSRKDVEAAGKWIESLPKGELKNRGARAMSNALRRDDPAAAITWAEQLPAQERESELRSIFTFWRRGDASQKMKLMEASTLPEEMKAEIRRREQFSPRNGDLRKIMELSSRDPEAAKKLLAEMPEGRERDYIQAFIDRRATDDSPEMHAIRGKVRTDPKAAMALLDTLPDGPSKESMRQHIQSRLDETNSEAAAKRLAALPEGRERDREIRRSVVKMMRTNPEHAASLAELLGPDRRNQMLEMAYQQWLKEDPERAGVALQKSSLPDERKKFLQPQADKD